MRNVTKADAAAIAALDMELFPDRCLNETTLAREIGAGGGLVLYEADELIAYVLVRWDWEVMDVIRIGVRPSRQGFGLGTRLLLNVLSTSHMDAILCVDKLNKRALKLYREHGFSIVGQLARSWVMRRKATS